MADSVYKVVELVGTSGASWEEAAKKSNDGTTIPLGFGDINTYQ